jgi:hypothetical protein
MSQNADQGWCVPGAWSVRNSWSLAGALVCGEWIPLSPELLKSRRVAVAKKSKRKYSKGASNEVENEMSRYKRGKAKSGKGGKGGKVKSRKQAIAIGLSKARKKGKKAPKKRKSKKKNKTKKKSS